MFGLSPTSRNAPHHRERGVTLVLFALLMAAMVFIVALVVDYSFVRNTRQDGKRLADAATAAGLFDLADDGYYRPWEGVCAALTYAQANESGRTFTFEYMDGDGDASPMTCSTLSNQECVANSPDSWAWIRATSADMVIDIKSGYITPDADFDVDQDAYASDNGASDRGGCDQIAVIVSDIDEAYFGGIGGRESYKSRVRSVGRAVVGGDDGVPAFIMLERTGCGVLARSNYGSGDGAGIVVEAASSTEPGAIHIDSKGIAGCTGGPESSVTVFSDPIGGEPGILVKPAGTEDAPIPGILSLHALRHNPLTTTGWGSASGVSPGGTDGPIISRAPVDTKYRPTVMLATIHSTAYTDANRSSGPDSSYHPLTCSDNNGVYDQSRIFVNCPTGYSPQSVTFSEATDVIFNGPVQVSGAGPSGRELYIPKASRIVVGGNATRGLEVNGGRLGIGSAHPFDRSADGAKAACNGREGPPDGPAPTNTTTLVIFGGSPTGAGAGGLNVSGQAALCQTFVYLAGPKNAANATYTQKLDRDRLHHSSCIPATPCPTTNNDYAHLDISGYVRWVAPNTTDVVLQPPFVGIEDLALWTETSTKSEIKSGGVMDTQGVFFLPNGRLEMRSPAEANPRDAQFIARSLKLFQGTLQMKPTEANSISAPVLRGSGLVR